MSTPWKRLGASVFRRRVDLNMTSRRALAEAAGVGKRTVDSLESGERVSATSLYKIETALGWVAGSAEQVLAGAEPRLADEEERAGEVDSGLPDGLELRDDVEQQLWDLADIPEDLRISFILQRRARREADALRRSG